MWNLNDFLTYSNNKLDNIINKREIINKQLNKQVENICLFKSQYTDTINNKLYNNICIQQCAKILKNEFSYIYFFKKVDEKFKYYNNLSNYKTLYFGNGIIYYVNEIKYEDLFYIISCHIMHYLNLKIRVNHNISCSNTIHLLLFCGLFDLKPIYSQSLFNGLFANKNLHINQLYEYRNIYNKYPIIYCNDDLFKIVCENYSDLHYIFYNDDLYVKNERLSCLKLNILECQVKLKFNEYNKTFNKYLSKKFIDIQKFKQNKNNYISFYNTLKKQRSIIL